MADTKISALTAATAAIGADEFAINEAGTSKKLTLDQVWNGLYAPGSFTIPTGQFRIMAGRLELTGSQTLTIEGTGRLVID
jgi:hypothetical protein